MSKSKNTKSTDKIPSSSTKSNHKAKTQQTTTKSRGGLDEIDSLFESKKESTKQLQKQIQQEEEDAKIERRRRKEARLAEEEEEMALRGGPSTSTTAAAGKKKGDATAPQSLHAKAQTLKSLTYTRSDLQQLNSTNSEQKDKWASDGLGGVFNGEGYTGRRDEGGHRVFKAHLMNREGFGGSKDCPFDCDCCFI